jgi:hypothetical protein
MSTTRSASPAPKTTAATVARSTTAAVALTPASVPAAGLAMLMARRQPVHHPCWSSPDLTGGGMEAALKWKDAEPPENRLRGGRCGTAVATDTATAIFMESPAAGPALLAQYYTNKFFMRNKFSP